MLPHGAEADPRNDIAVIKVTNAPDSIAPVELKPIGIGLQGSGPLPSATFG
ncbi:MAG: hypothetical protein U0401_21155 [Anaerolineae bacterium]